MTGKHLNSGIRGGLWDEKHYRRMGDAIWLFGWLVHRQTTEKNGEGLVLRGMLLSYGDIMRDMGFGERTLRRWMGRLRDTGYISVKHGCYKKLIIRVLNAKKFSPRQLSFPLVASPAGTRANGNFYTPAPSVSFDTLAGGEHTVFQQTFPQGCRPELADIAARSGRLKEGVEIEHKLQKRRFRPQQLRSAFARVCVEIDTIREAQIGGRGEPASPRLERLLEQADRYQRLLEEWEPR